MVTVAEASEIIFHNLFKPAVLTVSLIESTGKVLAEQISADRDFPPFNRVSMDGIAISYAAWEDGQRTFPIGDTQAAGAPQKSLADPSRCMEVMTGAILPLNCDAVIRYEDLAINGTKATIHAESMVRWQNIHRQSMDAQKDEVLLEPGISITPSEVALMASVGKSKVAVYAHPRAAIISTGDELVDIDDQPLPHQIRRSNAYALQSAMRGMDWDGVIFHLQDEALVMEQALKDIFQQYDVIILSGGVSKGKFDFVPQVLERVGIHQVFHHVSQRPGKPFWFGKSLDGKIAFALPGNPVSTFMCFYKYVKPWLFKSLGVSYEHTRAILAKDFSFPASLTCFLQVSVQNEGGKLMAFPRAGQGSGDFANLKNVSGFLELPLEKNDFKAGEVFPYIPFRH